MNLDRIASLLSSGLKATQVATIVGCSPARISQLLSTEDFKLLVDSKIATLDLENIEEVALSNKYNAAEHALIKQVMEKSEGAELRDVVSALRVVGERQEKMKTRMNPSTSPNSQTIVQVVSITLPSHALPKSPIEMTGNGEVISIGEQTLAPLSSTAVTNLFSNLSKKQKGEQNDNPGNLKSPEACPVKVIPVAKEDSFLDFFNKSKNSSYATA